MHYSVHTQLNPFRCIIAKHNSYPHKWKHIVGKLYGYGRGFYISKQGYEELCRHKRNGTLTPELTDLIRGRNPS